MTNPRKTLMKLFFQRSVSKFSLKAIIDYPKLEQKPNYFDNGGKKNKAGQEKVLLQIVILLSLHLSTNDDVFSIACHQMEEAPWMNDTLKNFTDYERVEEEKPSQIPV